MVDFDIKSIFSEFIYMVKFFVSFAKSDLIGKLLSVKSLKEFKPQIARFSLNNSNIMTNSMAFFERKLIDMASRYD